jgi:hypothetical protein
MEAVATAPTADGPLGGFANIVRSEFCKLRSVRSTAWMLGAAAAFNVGLAALVAMVLPEHLKQHLDPIRISLGGLHLSQIAIGVLGVLAITSEYETGTIRVTLSAVPRRRLVLAAKGIVFAATALVVGTAACFAAYFVFRAFVADDSLRTSLGDAGVLRAVIGGGLYLTVLGLFGLGLGAILRSSAGAIAALFAVLFVPPLVLELLPPSWQDTIGPYVPLEAGSQVFSLRHDAGALGAWSGFGVFCLYATVALGVGFVLVDRRDA